METVKTIVPIDLEGLKALSDKGKENPTAVRTLKCKTVARSSVLLYCY